MLEFVGLIAGVAVATGLLLRPLLALQVAVCLALFPLALRPYPFYMIASNGALAVAVCAWLLSMMTEGRSIRWNVTCTFLLLYIAWGVVTLIWAPDWVLSRKELVQFVLSTTLLVLLVNQLRNARALDALMLSLRVIGWLLVIGGSIEIAAGGFEIGERIQILGMNSR